LHKLTLYTKSKCHLCDEMKEVVLRLKDKYEFDFEEVDIENDKVLYQKYEEKIPVLFVDGKMFAKYSVDEEKLRRKLNL
jgi:glutaredoxin